MSDATHDSAGQPPAAPTAPEPPVDADATGTRLPAPTPIAQQSWPEGTVPLVSICCITYNHGPFIRQCLDGFLMQETTFPVEILIHDDASTDDTAAVIREYAQRHPGLFKPILQTKNQHSKGIKPNPTFNYPRAQGDFIAFCEGDDFWVRSDKLLRQVEFLEKNPTYSLCWTRFETLDHVTGRRERDGNDRWFVEPGGCQFGFHEFCTGWHMGTQTLVFRREAMNFSSFNNRAFRDIFLVSDLLTWGDGYCLPDTMAVYRIHEGGIHSSKSSHDKAAIAVDIYKEIYLAHRNNEALRDKYDQYCAKYIVILLREHRHSDALRLVAEFIAIAGWSSEYTKTPRVLSRIERRLRQLDQQIATKNRELAAMKRGPLQRLRRMLDPIFSRIG